MLPLLVAGAIGLVGAEAALIAPAVRKVQVDSLGEKDAEIVPAKSSFVLLAGVAKDGKPAAETAINEPGGTQGRELDLTLQ